MGACTIDPGWKIKMCEGGKEGEARKTRETQNREERRERESVEAGDTGFPPDSELYFKQEQPLFWWMTPSQPVCDSL